MENTEDMETRWKQRFQNFEKAYLSLEETVQRMENEELDDLAKMGFVQQFEILSELSWKVMLDYLINKEVSVKHNPVDTIRHAFQNALIKDVKDAEMWMEAVKKRNEANHTYDNKIFREVVQFAAKDFYFLVRDLYHQLKKEI